MTQPTRRHEPQRLRLAAGQDTPWLGVHLITEFIFCPRAGLLLYEQNPDEEEPEETDLPQLDYVPHYQLSEIERALTRAIQQLRMRGGLLLLILASIVGVLKVVFGVDFWWILWPLGAYAVFAIPMVLGGPLGQIANLNSERDEARKAKPHEPNPQTTDNEPVNWWGLLKAGFDSVPYRESLRDPRWRVAGRPWRVLRKGSLRIPVWRRRKGDETDRRLRGQHYARMAAYCHLIKEVEGAESPYGVILFGDTYQGVTVSDGVGSRTAFHRGLRAARDVIRQAQAGTDPAVPQRPPCRGCPYGTPYVYQPGESDGNRPPYLKRGVDDRNYHSKCGDRFRWVPPHQKAADKALV
jgi:hypothetical protein